MSRGRGGLAERFEELIDRPVGEVRLRVRPARPHDSHRPEVELAWLEVQHIDRRIERKPAKEQRVSRPDARWDVVALEFVPERFPLDATRARDGHRDVAGDVALY